MNYEYLWLIAALIINKIVFVPLHFHHLWLYLSLLIFFADFIRNLAHTAKIYSYNKDANIHK